MGERKPVLLVLDDDAAIRHTWTIIFRQQGYDVVPAENGEEAIRAAREHSPDALLADIHLPDMTGVEAARQISAIVPGCYVLLISGDGESSEVIEEARAQGVSFEVLPKPIAPSELIVLVAERLKKAS